MNIIDNVRLRVWFTAAALAAVVTAGLGGGLLSALEALDRHHAARHLRLIAEQMSQYHPLPVPPPSLYWWRVGEWPGALPAGLAETAARGRDSGVWHGEDQAYLWVRVPDPVHGDLIIAERHTPLHLTALWHEQVPGALLALAALILLGLWGTHRLATTLSRARASDAALHHQALHDRLTGLPNRELLQDRLEQHRLQAERERSVLALCLLDLDRFKDINDTLGHAVGDALIAQLANRLRSALRRSDTLARIGGDEFAIILPGVAAEQARRVADKLIRTIEEPVSVDGENFYLSASCGIALYPDHGRDGATLLRHADTAMFSAKRNGEQIVVYTPRLDQWDRQRLALIPDLRQAIESDGLQLYYQPKVDIRSGRLVGAEALARWEHPRLGPIAPATFIRLAEHTGLIKPLTRWVLKQAFADLREFAERGHTLQVSINLSALDLLDPRLHQHITALAKAHRIEPAQVTLELTETEVMTNPERSRQALEALCRQGFRIALDDFGTGYASLENLRRLPVGEIKIDRSFVTNLESQGDDAAIVRATISLAEALGLDLVAEGVENDNVARLLDDYGCSVLQGYYIARPMPKAALLRWLEGMTAETTRRAPEGQPSPELSTRQAALSRCMRVASPPRSG